jgi:hypothetical protein
MDIVGKRPITSVILAFVIGLAIGWFALGWGLWPVTYTGAQFQDLSQADQESYARAIAELYSFDHDAEQVRTALAGWGGEVVACQMAAKSADPADAARLRAIANVVTNQECAGITAETPIVAGEEEGSSLGFILTLFIALVLLVGAIVFVIRRRGDILGEDSATRRYADVPDLPPMMDDEGIHATPLARFRTSYVYGHDTYDDSFSIEMANGEFLGECGVGISESIGTDAPKSVTAFEVWLFDKNDIRTVTKVIMSDHAFFDEALKAKLAPKGEPILSRENETVVLETASLIINAEIKEMQYGTGVLPAQSFFERMTIELSAWAKEGEVAEPDVEGRVDEILNY